MATEKETAEGGGVATANGAAETLRALSREWLREILRNLRIPSEEVD